MSEDRYTPEEQQATQQLSAAPKPNLETAAREAIREQMLSEFRSTINPMPRPIPQRRMTRPILRVAALAAAVTVIAIGLVLAQSSNRQAATQNSITLTAAESHQTTSPTDTLPLTTVAVVPTQLSLSPTVIAPEAAATTVPSQLASAAFISITPTATELPGATFTATLPLTILTPTLPEAGNAIVVIEGPITSIIDNTLTINDFNVQVAPENPILSVIDVGDVVHVVGTFDSSGVIVANIVSNITNSTSASSTPVTVGLDGPVGSINGTELVVNSVPVRLDPNDPLVGKLHVGDFVRLQGNFQGSGITTVLMVINITIVNNVVVNGTPTCRYDVDGMGMGHWHCDGMGMGEPAMGMGDDGMGMGEPGMGMGG